jgi:hypothetical protein
VPAHDGQLLFVRIIGLPTDADHLDVAKRLADLAISKL